MDTCPCGSQQSFQACCALIHSQPHSALHAEQIMRARYSAFVLKDIDFIVRTYHSSCNAEQDRTQIQQATDLKWVKLEVVNSSKDDTYAFVEFKAWYLEDNALQLLHECSRFIKETSNNQTSWRYLDGVYPQQNQVLKTKRNDPCPCNSGKKFKKCCG